MKLGTPGKVAIAYLGVGAAWAAFSWFWYPDSGGRDPVGIAKALFAWPYDLPDTLLSDASPDASTPAKGVPPLLARAAPGAPAGDGGYRPPAYY